LQVTPPSVPTPQELQNNKDISFVETDWKYSKPKLLKECGSILSHTDVSEEIISPYKVEE
jgi:hypothetical protein